MNGNNLCMENMAKEVSVTIAKPSIQHCQEGQQYKLESGGYECSYSCRFSWNIIEVQKRFASKNITLYSPPFYTAGNNGGYKMCLFLYMDGDGSGKGTHLSFYIAVMRGEHDDRLMWPFQQKITLTLEDQNHQQHDITHCFKPDPAEYNASFQRPSPHSEMNVAFGFPQFAPLTVLDNPSYVKDDVLRLHCIVDTTGA